ncbi:MAG: DUF2834 domain-containing protein [Elusimicrobia bacterium]|nr:DUF2834 domain-containing protein [Elusimicrobiota bacterium]
MTRSRKGLCLVYAIVALVALVACWRENWSYVPAGPIEGLVEFCADLMLTPASRSITWDISLFFLSAAVWMGTEARRLRIPWAAAYVLAGLVVGVSFAFPLFLIARERALARLDSPKGDFLTNIP